VLQNVQAYLTHVCGRGLGGNLVPRIVVLIRLNFYPHPSAVS
jgi:hypothetical protein